MKYVYIDESPNYKNKYIIYIKADVIGLHNIDGYLSVFEARVMGLSYAQYLRYCRDTYEAEIIGKNEYAPRIYFTKKNAEKLAKVLDSRIAQINKLDE